MKKIILFAVIVSMLTACGYEEKTEILTDNLVKYSAQTDDGQETWGVKNQDGKIIIPANYEEITFLKGELITHATEGQYIYNLQGKRYVNRPAEAIDIQDEYFEFAFNEGNYYLLKQNQKLIGPAKNIKYSNYIFLAGDSSEVYTKEGNLLLGGKQIKEIISERKSYFLVNNKELYDSAGHFMFKANAKKIGKLPADNWMCGDSISGTITAKKIKSFK